jgi:predicted DCC family thiol-disulfide oxidoreductase YuxK
MIQDLLFYDGDCGLCHRWVRFVLDHDPDGSRFRFAPLGGETWRAAKVTGGVPDSLVLVTADGRVLFRSAAVLEIGERLGGHWKTLARIAGLLPRWLLDLGYDGVARARKHIFARPAGSCPIVPADLRDRFLA